MLARIVPVGTRIERDGLDPSSIELGKKWTKPMLVFVVDGPRFHRGL